MSNQPGIAPGGEDEEEELVPAAEPALEAPEEEVAELDEDAAEAAADAAAAAEEAGAAPASALPAPAKSAVHRVVPLNPQARDGLIRCLQARIAHLDTTLAHAQDVALKDSFYSRWPNVVGELRAQAVKRLEELQRS
jgi:hypothetical protein